MYSYEMIKNILSYAVALKPDGAFPLDARVYFGSYNDAVVAAASAKPAGSTESVYFYGQQIYVVENDVVTTYLIQVDGSLKEVGSATLGDEKTITLGEDGVLSLKSFGKEYYAYVPADVVIEGTYNSADELPTANAGEYALVGEVYYKYDGENWTSMGTDFALNTEAKHVLIQGWKIGLEPKVVAAASGTGYELAWYEPSSTTVEGLTSIVSGVQTSVDNLNTAVTENKAEAAQAVAAEEDARIAADEALSERISANKASIDILNGDASTEGSVLQIVNTVLAALVGDGSKETIDSLTELVEWANSHNTEIVEMNNAITKNGNDITALQNLVGELPEGVTATTIVAYIAEAVAAEKARAEAVEADHATRIKATEDAIDALGTASTKNAEEFATAAQGAKADTAVQSVVAGETNGHIAVDGNDVSVYELPVADVSTLGGVKPDASSISADAEGKISVVAVDHTKVTGLATELKNAADSATEAANEYTDETAVAKANVVASVDDLADSTEAASGSKVISEAALLQALTWVEGM